MIGACAASSHFVSEQLKEEFRKRKIRAQFMEVRASDVPQLTKTVKPDLIIFTASIYPKEGIPPDIPVLNGIPLLSGIGAQELINKIAETITKKKQE